MDNTGGSRGNLYKVMKQMRFQMALNIKHKILNIMSYGYTAHCTHIHYTAEIIRGKHNNIDIVNSIIDILYIFMCMYNIYRLLLTLVTVLSSHTYHHRTHWSHLHVRIIACTYEQNSTYLPVSAPVFNGTKELHLET